MLYFEDLKLGDKFNTAEHTVTAEEIIAFGRQYDPQPFHTDPGAAKATLFGQLVASGWHTAAVSMSLMVRGEMNLDGGVIGQGVRTLTAVEDNRSSALSLSTLPAASRGPQWP